MNSYFQDVKLFHDKFRLITPPAFTFLPDDLHKFRTAFFREEHQEYIDSCSICDLGTAFDSLIDLVYIVCGAALLHGINDFEAMLDETECECYDLFHSDEPAKEQPGYLTVTNRDIFNQLIVKNIKLYELAHKDQNEELTKSALVGIYKSVMMCASDMGCKTELWDELWNDVQRANMSKVRAERPSDSKRGSTWDVIKPHGWISPRTEEILAKHME